MDELKPCPFCGGKVRIYGNSGFRSFFIEHKSDSVCFDEVVIPWDNAESLSRAAEIWNRRSES